jgi:hypothetical protein
MTTAMIGTLDSMASLSRTTMKIMIVVGARPNFMKAAPLIAAIREHNRKAAVSEYPGDSRSHRTAL